MAKLTAAQRHRLAQTASSRASNFGFPSKAPGSGSYPIHDVVHARSALSYGSRFLSPTAYASLKRKIKKKYPAMAIS